MALWTVHGDGRRVTDGAAVAPDERLSWPLTIGFGVQHSAAMFGATILVPVATGFPPTTALLFSGLGTLLFLLITRNRVPAYVGSSFAFIAPLVAARENGIAAQLGGVLAAGMLLVVVGIAVKALGARLLESLMPPAVAGAVVTLVGLNNLAKAATVAPQRQPGLAMVTLAVILVCGLLGRGLLARVCVLVGVLAGWTLAAMAGEIDPVRVQAMSEAALVGLPQLVSPQIQPAVVLTVLPVVVVLVAENVGHVKATASVIGRNLDGSVGDVLIANGLSTALAGFGGGPGTTTRAENIGVMTVTKVYSTATYAVAAVAAIVLSFSPKIDALLATMPSGVLEGATLLLYGLIALVGARIWIEGKVDLLNPVNMLAAAAALVAGVGNLTVRLGGLDFGGIAWGTLFIVTAHPLLRAMYAARRR